MVSIRHRHQGLLPGNIKLSDFVVADGLDVNGSYLAMSHPPYPKPHVRQVISSFPSRQPPTLKGFHRYFIVHDVIDFPGRFVI